MKQYIVAVTVLITSLVFAVGCAGPGSVENAPETDLFLTVTEPVDESIINTNKVEVMGYTISDAVVSVIVNDEVNVVEVGEQGNFSITVTLDVGPNTIEVHASDWEGNEISTILAIIYTP